LLGVEIETNEAAIASQESEWDEALGRLAQMEACDASRDMFQRFAAGEITVKQLNVEIDRYLRDGAPE